MLLGLGVSSNKNKYTSSVPHQWPVTSIISNGSILDPSLFDIFMNDLDDEAECTSLSLQMIQIWEAWLLCQRDMLPFRGTLTGWRNGVKGTS